MSMTCRQRRTSPCFTTPTLRTRLKSSANKIFCSNHKKLWRPQHQFRVLQQRHLARCKQQRCLRLSIISLNIHNSLQLRLNILSSLQLSLNTLLRLNISLCRL